MIGMYCKALYLNFLAYVSCSPTTTPSSVPGRIAVLGFGWFLLITMASYTANLAAILVEEKSNQGITGIDDAIKQKLAICCVPQIQAELMSVHPEAKLKLLKSVNAIVRGLNKGECGVGIMTDLQSRRFFSGEYNERDCEAISSMTDAQAADTETGAVCIRLCNKSCHFVMSLFVSEYARSGCK